MSTRISVDTVATSRFNLPAPFRDAGKQIIAKQNMIAAVLSKSPMVSAEQFLVAAMAEVNGLEMANQTVQYCPNSIVKAVFNCATLGLLFGPTRGHAYLVPFNKRGSDKKLVNLIIGYKGYIELAYRSNFLKTVDTEVVLSGEIFKARMTEGGRKLRHDLPIERRAEKNGSNVVGAYCVYSTIQGGIGMSVVTKAEIDAVKKDSETWNFSYPAMARKTAVRRAAKNWSLTEQLSAAIHLDEAAEREAEQPALFINHLAPEDTPSASPSLPPSLTLQETAEADGDVVDYFESLEGVPPAIWITKLLDSVCIGMLTSDQMTHIVDNRLPQTDPRCNVIVGIWRSNLSEQLNEMLADVESLRQGGVLTADLYAAMKRLGSQKLKELA